MKIRCTDCGKKISIDDAFAGGVCRCPYCSTLVFVPEEGGEAAAGGPRPESPTARPQTPAEMEAVAKARGQEHIPVALPVKIQGIVTIVLIGLLFAMFIGAVALYLAYRPREPKTTAIEDYEINPFIITIKGPAVAGNIPLEPPVVYVADAGGGMSEVFDYVDVMVRKSLPTLGEGPFTVLLAREKEPKSLGAMKPAGAASQEALDDLFRTPCEGSSDVPLAFKAAIDLKPKTIVLFTAKAVETVGNLVSMAKEQGITVHTVLLGPEEESARLLAKETGGRSRIYSRPQLHGHITSMRK